MAMPTVFKVIVPQCTHNSSIAHRWFVPSMSQLDAIEIQIQVYAKSPLSGIAKTNPGHRNWYHCVEWAQFGLLKYCIVHRVII